jgi:hypothetical protein
VKCNIDTEYISDRRIIHRFLRLLLGERLDRSGNKKPIAWDWLEAG